MKQSKLTLTVGIVVAVIFALLLFVFQVRTTEVAVVTTFGKPTKPITEPGAYFKWPWPIQNVYLFDKRIHSFEDTFEETLTQDSFNLLVMLYVGWSISEPDVFLRRFANGSVEEAQHTLEGLVRSAKQAVIGKSNFSDFISTDPEKVKLAEIERRILESVQNNQSQYGITVHFLGIKKLGLPESITEKVIARMEAERRKYVSQLEGEGEEQSTKIRSGAEKERDNILARAEAEAKRIRGEGEAEAAKYYSVFRQDPDFATFLQKVAALEQVLQGRSTLVLDQRTPPLDLLSPPEKTEESSTKENETGTPETPVQPDGLPVSSSSPPTP